MFRILALGNETMLVALLLAPNHVRNPGIPRDPKAPLKPPTLVGAIIAAIALHPIAILIGYILVRRRAALGRIRLEEEVEAADQRVRQAEAEAEEARAAMGRD